MTTQTKERLDKRLVDLALAPTREKAQALILAGKVKVADVPAQKAGMRVALDATIELTGKDHPYVSRGGVKLEGALREFDIDPSGMIALDIGASTGGFTHCLLLHGAKKVFAVDVGYGQLAWELRQDDRVVVMERTNIRTLESNALGEAVDLVVVDVSFIALTKVLADACRFLKPDGAILSLVKPQFEAGRELVQKRGKVTSPDVHQQVLKDVAEAGEALGLVVIGQKLSAITGKKSGNQEYFVYWRRLDDGQNIKNESIESSKYSNNS